MDNAGRWHSTQPPGLIGRVAEASLLEDFVRHRLGHGEALMITGGPGVGKSALLDDACRTAATGGARVLRAAGVQFEAEVSFAGLNQLFLPLHDQLGELPETHAQALSGALGIGTGARAGRLVVSAAALALLQHVARRERVVVVLDDVQWLDPSSARVLAFIARRLEASRIRLLAAARNQADCLLLQAGLPELELPPLDERTAAQLLASRFPGLAASVRRRLLSAAQGNPLALLELPASMTEDQRRAVVPLPPVLSLSDQLQALYADRVHNLPDTTRRLLLLAALDGTGDCTPLRACSSGDSWLDDLAPAERASLIRIDPSTRRVAFRHPLIGAAAVELATTSERRRAHALLADLLTDDPERRAWHLAEAVVGPQEAEAVAHVAAMQRAEIFRLRPRLALIAAGATALIAPGKDADARYVAALTLPGVEQFPFERARLQLAYGEHLRRSRAAAAAREELTAALETFQRLGAHPWVLRTMQELRASGQAHLLQQKRGGPATLTPQEHEIASLAASGLSNKQIGGRLYLSPRTVSGHLYRIFPKLGVSSRAALRDALSQAPPARTHR